MNEDIYQETEFDGYLSGGCTGCTEMRPGVMSVSQEFGQCRKHVSFLQKQRLQDFKSDPDFFELRSLRITRHSLLNVGLDADTILVRELITKQLKAKTIEDSIIRIRVLFTFLLTIPEFLTSHPKMLASIQERIYNLAHDPRMKLLQPLMKRLLQIRGALEIPKRVVSRL
jgi:hypothetical protein